MEEASFVSENTDCSESLPEMRHANSSQNHANDLIPLHNVHPYSLNDVKNLRRRTAPPGRMTSFDSAPVGRQTSVNNTPSCRGPSYGLGDQNQNYQQDHDLGYTEVNFENDQGRRRNRSFPSLQVAYERDVPINLYCGDSRRSLVSDITDVDIPSSSNDKAERHFLFNYDTDIKYEKRYNKERIKTTQKDALRDKKRPIRSLQLDWC